MSNQSKTKKKRNKRYTGNDSVATKPVITRVTASNRSRKAQWWYERRKLAKPLIIALVILLILLYIIIFTYNAWFK